MSQLGQDLDPKYTEICSQRTVQSNERGFFEELFTNVHEQTQPQWVRTHFGGERLDRVASMRALLSPDGPTGDVLDEFLDNVQPVFRPKDARVSVERRRDGERFVAGGDWTSALTMLSQAVMRAPGKEADLQSDGGMHLALALWARSGVLLELGNGPAAVADLQYALQCGLPAKQHGAYYLRLARAHAMSRDKAKATVCLALAERLAGDAETRRGLAAVRGEVEAIAADAKPALDDHSRTIDPKAVLAAGPHADVAGASRLIDIRSDAATTITGAGQYAVASAPIRPGDVLLVERPIVCCLRPDCQPTHCAHCMRMLQPPGVVPYGCDECSAVAFCSPACQRAACTSYHRYECAYGDLLIGSGMSVLCLMALRAVAQCGSVDEALQRSGAAVRDLCGHANARQPVDRLRRAVMAAFLLRIVQRSGFFGPGRRHLKHAARQRCDEQELRIGAALLGWLEVLQFNAHEIYETRMQRDHRFAGSKAAYVGVALYRTGAYFNHDCHPAVSRHFVGTSIVLTATRPLGPGEMIGENYGPIFTKCTLAERQRELRSRYWFRCACSCCAEDWTTLKRLDNRARLRCPSAGCAGLHAMPADAGKAVVCRKCRTQVRLADAVQAVRRCEEHYRRAAQLMEDQKTAEAIGEFVAGIELFYTVAVPPHRDTQIAQESLRTCLADGGTVVKCLTPVRQQAKAVRANANKQLAIDDM